MFLEGLRMYNKQWKLIAELVKTRTVVQIRTHAQKYFQKLEKVRMTNVSTPLGSETEVRIGSCRLAVLDLLFFTPGFSLIHEFQVWHKS